MSANGLELDVNRRIGDRVIADWVFELRPTSIADQPIIRLSDSSVAE
jgi:hypothetical protein